ncbi:hypothetical protein WN48_05357 [Eufriesea mexicana]|nr:hypothetical protein WN48_05357 [Eufriesea mexicana]
MKQPDEGRSQTYSKGYTLLQFTIVQYSRHLRDSELMIINDQRYPTKEDPIFSKHPDLATAPKIEALLSTFAFDRFYDHAVSLELTTPLPKLPRPRRNNNTKTIARSSTSPMIAAFADLH